MGLFWGDECDKWTLTGFSIDQQRRRRFKEFLQWMSSTKQRQCQTCQLRAAQSKLGQLQCFEYFINELCVLQVVFREACFILMEKAVNLFCFLPACFFNEFLASQNLMSDR